MMQCATRAATHLQEDAGAVVGVTLGDRLLQIACRQQGSGPGVDDGPPGHVGRQLCRMEVVQGAGSWGPLARSFCRQSPGPQASGTVLHAPSLTVIAGYDSGHPSSHISA